MGAECESCINYGYDEQTDSDFCSADADEDELWRVMESGASGCPYFRRYDDYDLAKKQ